MNFPLYTSLCVNLSSKDLTVVQKTDFIKKIEKIDKDTHELIFALIKSYFIDKERGDTLAIPYEGKISKDTVTFDINNLPIPLRQLLYKFLTINEKKIEEDQQMQTIQTSH